MRMKSHLPPGRPPDGSFRRPEPRPPDPQPSTNPDPRPHHPISRPASLRPSRWPRFLLILFITLSHAAVPKVTGPVVESTGQSLQGAVRDLSGEGSAQDGLSNSRYLTTYGVAFSQDGRTVYVGEAYKNRVLAVDVALGTATTVAGGNRGLQDGPTHTAKFSWPYGVALSPNSNTLYVADSGNDCIRAIALDAGQVSTIAGGGAGSRGFQDGPAAKAKFAWPYGVATSPDGHTVYVGDSGNNRVRSIDVLSGTVSTLAGTGIAGYQDGAASAARFYGPRGVVASPDGSLVFVADYSNFRVRTLELAGGEHGEATVSTLFGGKGEIYRPAGVAVTSNGEWVLAADSANAKIRGVQMPLEDSQPPPSSHHPPLSPGLPPARGSSMGGVERLDDVNTSRWTSSSSGSSKGSSWGMGSGMGMGSEIEEMHIRHAIMAIGLFVVVALMGAGALVAAALYGRRNALRELSQYKSLSHGGGSHAHHLSRDSLGEHRSKQYAVREYAEQSRRASYEDRVSGDLHHNSSIILDMPQDDHVALDMGVSVDDLLAGMEGLTDRLTAGSSNSPPGSSGSRSPGGRSATYGGSPPRGYNPLRPEQTSAGSNFSRRERESVHVVRRTTSGMLPEGGMSSDSLHRGVLQHQRSADGTVFRRSNY